MFVTISAFSFAQKGNADDCMDVGISRREHVMDLYEEELRLKPDNADAHFNLALEMLETDNSPKTDMVEHMRRAAELGHKKAFAYLASFYITGTGVEKNAEQAVKWLTQAVEAGVPDAMANLATLYYRGEGVPKDIKKAYLLSRKAIEQDPGCSMAYYNMFVYLRDLNPENPDKSELERVLRRAADLGDIDAMVYLAEEYSSDDDLFELNPKAAFVYWFRAAVENDSRAFAPLAECYLNGSGTEKNVEEGLEYVRRAARENHPECMMFLAREYGDAGGLLPLDFALSIKWCRRFLQVKPDDADMLCLLADNLFKVFQTDRNQSFANYVRAAALKHPRAVYRLGRAWEEGWAYEQENRQPANQDKAAQYYLQALELGNAEAAGALVRMADFGYTGVEYSPADWVNMLKIGADAGVKGCAAKLAAYYHPKGGQQPDAEISAAWMKIALERDKTPWAMTLRGWELVAEHEEAASPEKLREAARLFRLAADRGDAAALAGLGWLHLQENGPLAQNPGKSIELFRQAARMGEPIGAEMIADMCADGDGVKKDWWLSRKWRRYARSIEYRRKDKKTTLIELVD